MSKRKKKRNILKKNLPTLIIILLLAGAGYFYIDHIEQKEIKENEIYQSKEAYHLLENKDSVKYLANILIETESSILDLSDKFYKSKMFWPYIFEENEIKDNILNIQTGAILRIPRIPAELLDTTNAQIVNDIRILGDSLLNDVNEKRVKKLESNDFGDW